MAHTKAKGSSKLGRDSNAQRLGVKVFGGQKIEAGQIIIRQRGSKYFSGANVSRGNDDTLYAKNKGIADFSKNKRRRFSNSLEDVTVVSVK